MSAGERGHPERAGLLAGRVDVVGEHDPARVSRQQRDLARRQRGAEAGDDVVEAGLVGHQRVGVALDDDRLARLADRALGLSMRYSVRLLSNSGVAGELRYFGPSPSSSRPPSPTAWPFWSRIGKMTRARNLS